MAKQQHFQNIPKQTIQKQNKHSPKKCTCFFFSSKNGPSLRFHETGLQHIRGDVGTAVATEPHEAPNHGVGYRGPAWAKTQARLVPTRQLGEKTTPLQVAWIEENMDFYIFLCEDLKRFWILMLDGFLNDLSGILTKWNGSHKESKTIGDDQAKIRGIFPTQANKTNTVYCKQVNKETDPKAGSVV